MTSPQYVKWYNIPSLDSLHNFKNNRKYRDGDHKFSHTIEINSKFHKIPPNMYISEEEKLCS